MKLFFQYDTILLETHENYQKRSYRNKMRIPGPHKLNELVVPLKKGKNSQKPIREVEISYDTAWQKEMIRSIRTSYGSAPFFMEYHELIFMLIQQKEQYLFDYNLKILRSVLKLLGHSGDVNLTDAFKKTYPGQIADFRNKLKRNSDIPTGLHYAQVFEDRHGFIDNCSILDLIFCAGPEASLLLRSAYKA